MSGTRFLPLFPLELVVFPGESLKLHIFEPRYRQLIAECRDKGITFGIPTYLKGGLAEYGTEMRLAEIVKTHDTGEMDIRTEGLGAFRLTSYARQAPGKLYAGGEIKPLANEPDAPADLSRELLELFNRLHTVLATGHTRLENAQANLSFTLAQESGLTLGQRLRLLSMPEEERRQVYLVEHLKQLIQVLEATEETKARLRANGRFHKFPTLDL